jgi:tetratricopeptide (TPR) repeat protein
MQSPTLSVDTTPFSLATRKLRAAAPAFIFFDQGNEFTQQGKFAWAISRYSEGIQASPDQAIIWLGRAEAYLETNQLREAEYDIAQAKKLYPDLFYTRYFAGALQCKQRRWQASLDELQAANEIVPDYPDAQFYMGFDCENLGRQREAAQFYHDYLKQVREGEKAQYAYRRLVDWGYIQAVQ